MTIWIDPPAWPAHDRLWSHLVSDVSVDELVAFADRAGLPRRGFSGDHYDVPQEWYADVVASGAQPTTSRDLVRRLRHSGLRTAQRRSDRLVQTRFDVAGPEGAAMRVDLFMAAAEPPDHSTAAVAVLLDDGMGRQAAVRSVARDAWGPPSGGREPGESVRAAAVREVAEETGVELPEGELRIGGYERLAFRDGLPHGRWSAPVVTIAVFTARLAGPVPALAPRAEDVDAAAWVDVDEFARRCGREFWWPLAAALLPADGIHEVGSASRVGPR